MRPATLLIRRFRTWLAGLRPRAAAADDALIVAFRAVQRGGGAVTTPGIVSADVFERQIAWLERRYVIAPLRGLGRGRAWGRKPAAVLVLEGGDASLVDEAILRLRTRGLPSTLLVDPGQVGTAGAYAWDDVKRVLGDPLVGIEAARTTAGAWDSLTPSDAVTEAVAALEAIETRLGVRPDAFAGPAGMLPDVRWLIAFDADERLRSLRAVLWTAEGVNPRATQRARARQWTRQPAPSVFGIRERSRWSWPSRIERYWRELDSPPPTSGPRAALSSAVSRRQVMAFLSARHPFKSQHHAASHLEYLYDRNPFRAEGVAPCAALVRDGVPEALATGVGVPVREDGVARSAVILSCWYRLPFVAHPLGGAPVAQAYLALACPVLVYDPTVFATAALRGARWLRLDADVFTARRLLGPRVTSRARIVESDAVSDVESALVACWRRLSAGLRFAVDRTPAYWRWKFERHPLGPYRFYAADGIGACALGWEGDRLLLADLVYDPDVHPLVPELSAFLGEALARAYSVRPYREIVAETDQRSVGDALTALGLRRRRSRCLHWRPTDGVVVGDDVTAYRSLADADFGVRPAL